MEGSKRSGKRPAEISESVRQRLDSYALVASAAGVSLLVLTQPAEARIVYTATHHVIGNLGSYNLDLNNDGNTDVTLFETNHSTTEAGQKTRLFANPSPNNLVKGYPWFTSIGPGLRFASALRPGQKIGGSQTRFGYSVRQTMAAAATQAGGPPYSYAAWGNLPLIPNRYLGVRFQIHGKNHYGWARLIVKVSGTAITATITGYAYETVADKTIVAGKKSDAEDSVEMSVPDAGESMIQAGSLGRLARGASGGATRRTKTAAALAGAAE